GGHAVGTRRRREIDALRADVVAEHLAELILRHLADKAGAKAERRKTRNRVGCRSAARLDARWHALVQPVRLLGIDQAHRPFDEPLAFQKFIVGSGNHVHNGIADGKNVEAGLGHWALLNGGWKGPPNRRREADQGLTLA